jgi:hypothetical protein
MPHIPHATCHYQLPSHLWGNNTIWDMGCGTWGTDAMWAALPLRAACRVINYCRLPIADCGLRIAGSGQWAASSECRQKCGSIWWSADQRAWLETKANTPPRYVARATTPPLREQRGSWRAGGRLLIRLLFRNRRRAALAGRRVLLFCLFSPVGACSSLVPLALALL